MKGMFQDSVVPYLNDRFGSQGVVTSYRYGVYDIREIDLENTLWISLRINQIRL